MNDRQVVLTQQLIREIATQVIRKLLQGLRSGNADVVGTCRDHPDFMQLPMEDRDSLMDAVYEAAESAQIHIGWSDDMPNGFITHNEPLTEEQYEDLKQRFLEAQKTQPIHVIHYPEIDYPQELSDQHEPWLPQINAIIEQYEAG